MKKKIEIKLKPNNEIPAFAGYVNHSVADPSGPEIVFNFRAMLFSCAEHNEGSKDYKRYFADSVVHEMLHMVQDMFDQAFNEDEVEDAIMHARKYLDSLEGKTD